MGGDRRRGERGEGKGRRRGGEGEGRKGRGGREGRKGRGGEGEGRKRRGGKRGEGREGKEKSKLSGLGVEHFPSMLKAMGSTSALEIILKHPTPVSRKHPALNDRPA